VPLPGYSAGARARRQRGRSWRLGALIARRERALDCAPPVRARTNGLRLIHPAFASRAPERAMTRAQATAPAHESAPAAISLQAHTLLCHPSMKRVAGIALASLFATLAVGCSGAKSTNDNAAAAATGPDGTEFVTESVPGDHCRSIVLRGTQRFKGRAYTLPQPYVATNKQGQRLFQVLQLASGAYVVRVGVYFPGGSGDAASNDLLPELPDCAPSFIQTTVNATLSADDQINMPEPMAINNVVVGLQGLPGSAMFGSNTTDILAYNGQDYVAEFNVPDVATLTAFLARLRSTIGAQLTFDMHFTARSSDGFANIDVDLSKVADRLDAGLAAGGNIHGVMAGVDFQAAVARAAMDVSVNVYMEPGREQAFSDLTKHLVDQLMANFGNLAPQLPATPDGGLPPSAVPSATGAAGAAAAVLPSVDVRAAISDMRQTGHFSYQVQSMTGNEQHTYSTNAIFRSSWDAPGVEHLRAYSDNTDSTYLYANTIANGTTVTLGPVNRTTDDVSYRSSTTLYMSKNDLLHDAHDMPSRFPILQQYPNSLVENGSSAVYMYHAWKINIFDWSYYYWGYETSVPTYSNTTTTPVTDFSDTGIKIQFSGANTFSLNDLATSAGQDWTASVDSTLGTLTLVAKKDLGQLKLVNADNYENTSVYPVRTFQRYYSSGGNPLDTQYSDADAVQNLPTKRSVVALAVQSTQHGQTVDPASVTVTSGADGAIHSPPAAPASH
jgi:hypothetical protein